ncbi:MAG: bacillithiol biosynthesis deacetylase BshB1 [Candidatus Zixiibacteriota bacterium]
MASDTPTKLDALAIAAHRDDIEITCGGLMIKLGDEGHATGALDLTQGEMGTLGDERDRAREADCAAGVMGLTYRANLALPDAAVEYDRPNRMKIAQVIRDTRPELVILPFWQQRHPDHLTTHLLGFDACFLAGLRKMNGLNGEPHRPRKIIYCSSFRDIRHSFYVDISEQKKRKDKAVACYESQFAQGEASKEIYAPGNDIFEYMEHAQRFYGQRVGVTYAEAYTIKENILIDNPLKMPVKSI